MEYYLLSWFHILVNLWVPQHPEAVSFGFYPVNHALHIILKTKTKIVVLIYITRYLVPKDLLILTWDKISTC